MVPRPNQVVFVMRFGGDCVVLPRRVGAVVVIAAAPADGVVRKASHEDLRVEWVGCLSMPLEMCSHGCVVMRGA